MKTRYPASATRTLLAAAAGARGPVNQGFAPVSLNGIAVDFSSPESVLTLLPEVEARAVLAGRDLRLRVLRPPYAALGTGSLRVLRVRECDAFTEIVAGYDGYERLGLAAP